MNKYMEEALKEAETGVNMCEGGPFGAVIVDSKGNVISKGHNMVLRSNDPTAHAEIMAIRNACLRLNTHDLKGYTLYVTCEPCPMCLSAVMWSNIDRVYYACTRKDADSIGFRDDKIYEYFNGDRKMLEIIQIDRDCCIDMMESYDKEMY